MRPTVREANQDAADPFRFGVIDQDAKGPSVGAYTSEGSTGEIAAHFDARLAARPRPLRVAGAAPKFRSQTMRRNLIIERRGRRCLFACHSHPNATSL